MSTLTATLDAPNARVRLDIDFSDVACPYAVVNRINEVTGVSTALRLPYPTATIAGVTVLNMWAGFKGVLHDTEMPLDTPVHYVASFTGSPQLLVNSTFDDRIAPWSPFGGAAVLTRTDFTAYPERTAMQVAFDGVTANLGAQAEYVPAAPGVTYTGSAALSSPLASGNRGVRLNFYNAALGLISSPTVSPVIGAGFTTVTNTAAAPALTAYVRMVVMAVGTPTTTNFLYVDNPSLTSAFAATATSASVTVPSLGRFWLRDPLRPAQDVPVDGLGIITDPACVPERLIVYVGNREQQRPAFASGFDVNNLPDQIVVARQRGGLAGTIYLATRTYLDRQAVDALLTPGTPLLWQVPPGWNCESGYLNVGTVAWAQFHPDERVEPRQASLPYRIAVAPAGPAMAPLGYRWMDTCSPYLNWQQATIAGVTWLQAADGGL